MSAPSNPTRRWRHAVQRLARWLAVVWCVFLGLVLGLRLYFSDERLRGLLVSYLHDKSSAEVELANLELSLLSGIEVGRFRLGPVPGFTRDTIRFERFAFHWSTWNLLRWRVVLPELALEGLGLTLEENDSGQNLQALTARLFPPSSAPTAAPVSPPVQTENPPNQVWQPPSLPVHVEVQRLALTHMRVDVVKPGLSSSIDEINIEGHFLGIGQAYDLDLYAGLGERAGQGAASHLKWIRADPAGAMDSEQRFGVTLEAHGVGDLELTVALDATTRVQKPSPLPTLHTRGNVRLTANLLSQTALLSACRFSLGEGTVLSLRGLARELLQSSPTIDLREFSFVSDLAELSPLLAATRPGTRADGQVAFSVQPFVADVAALSSPTPPPVALGLDLIDVAVAYGATRLDGLRGRLALATPHGEADVTLHLEADRVLEAGQDLHRLAMDLSVATPLAPWLGGPATGDIVSDLKMQFAHGGSPAALARGFSLSVAATTPVALVKHQELAPPLRAQMALTSKAVIMPSARLDDLELTLSTTSQDLAFERLAMDMRLAIAAAHAPLGEGVVTVPNTRLDLSLERDGDDYDVHQLTLALSDLSSLALSGALANTSQPVLAARNFKLELLVPQLAKLIALLPPAATPAPEVSGELRTSLLLDGVVDQPKLKRALALPVIAEEGADAWGAKVRSYADYLDAWARRFAEGMPFTNSFELALGKFSYRDAKTDVADVGLVFRSDIERHGTKFSLELNAGHVGGSTVLDGTTLTTHLAADREGLRFAFDTAVKSLRAASLTHPLLGAGMKFAAGYKFGGDLTLERWSLEAPDQGAVMALHGVLAKPLDFILTRGWERRLLPGIDARILWQLGYNTSGIPEALTVGGAKLGGKIGLDGELRIRDGEVLLTGLLGADEFYYLTPGTDLEAMSGTLPFALELVFDRRADAVVLGRDLTYGGGIMSLVASTDDVRTHRAGGVYYERVRPYRERDGLTIATIRSGNYEITNFRMDGRMQDGMFITDWFSMGLLGGDVTGNLALQLAPDTSVRGNMRFQMSGLDASYFKLLKLKAGPESELNADLSFGFLFGPKARDVAFDMNITKIGAQTFDRFLQLLDPTGKDSGIQSTRRWLGSISIDEVGMWIRYENLNMDLVYSTVNVMGIPIPGYRPIDREMLRRYSVSEYLDLYVQPSVNKSFAKPLGWAYAE